MSEEITGDRLDRILIMLGAANLITQEEAKALMVGLAWLEGTMKENPQARELMKQQGVSLEAVSKLLRS